MGSVGQRLRAVAWIAALVSSTAVGMLVARRATALLRSFEPDDTFTPEPSSGREEWES